MTSSWSCRRPRCRIVGIPHPHESAAVAEAASTRHQEQDHPPASPPADLEDQRAAWIAAGRPPLGG